MTPAAVLPADSVKEKRPPMVEGGLEVAADVVEGVLWLRGEAWATASMMSDERFQCSWCE